MKRKAKQDEQHEENSVAMGHVDDENGQKEQVVSSSFTPIEFSANDLMEDMKNKKKRRKKKNSSDQHNEQEATQQTTQKPFFVVDKKTIEKIDWKPPSDKNWLKGFFKPSESSSLEHHHSINDESTHMMESTEPNNIVGDWDNGEDMDELDMEAQKYLLNVRFEAQNFCEQTVVATNINSKDFDNNRSSMKEMDQSLYSTMHLFDAFESGTINVSSSWEESFMRSFKSQRNAVQSEIDKRLRGYTTSGSGNTKKYQHVYPPLNGYFDKWKVACLGEENVYILWEQYVNKQHTKDLSKEVTENPNEETSLSDENNSVPSTGNIDETSDSTSSSLSSSASSGKKKNRRGARKRQKRESSSQDATTDTHIDTKIPTHSLLTDYLDYLTIHALFSKMIHWTVSNFHNNSILRRKPSLVTSLFNTCSDDEEEEEENKEEKQERSTNKEKWISNYLMNESFNSDNIARCNWLYNLFLAIDKPPNDTIGANMNQLLVWILEHYSIFTPEEKEEFKKLVIIIIKYFGQGNPSIIKYQDEKVTSSGNTDSQRVV